MMNSRKHSNGFTMVELLIVICIIGVLAATAIPAYMKYIRKAKTTEATLNIKKLQEGAVSYYHEERVASGSAVPIPKQFPKTPATAIAPVLGACCPAKCSPISALWADPSWQALKFGMSDPHYYSYEYNGTAAGVGTIPASGSVAKALADGTTPTTFFFASAYGDLNCNGTYSTFEMFGAIDKDGSITTSAGLFSNNELE